MAAAATGILGGNLVSAMIGKQEFDESMDAAQRARQQSLQNYLNIHVPDPAQQQLILARYKATGKLDPEMEKAVSQGATDLANMNVNPQGREAEMKALQQLTEVSESGGLDALARQKLQEGINTANTNERGQIGAIQQNAAARGLGGSGTELAAELQSTQNNANASSSAGAQTAADAEQRALSAMTAEGTLGSTINNQDYNQAAERARAQDTINRFNTQNLQTVNNSNVTSRNSAAASNLANQQAVDNANTGVTNQEETSNKALLQSQFNNEMSLASAKANAENGLAAGYQAQGQNAANTWSNIGNAVGQGVAAIAKNSSSSNDGTPSIKSTPGQTTSDNDPENENPWV